MFTFWHLNRWNRWPMAEVWSSHYLWTRFLKITPNPIVWILQPLQKPIQDVPYDRWFQIYSLVMWLLLLWISGRCVYVVYTFLRNWTPWSVKFPTCRFEFGSHRYHTPSIGCNCCRGVIPANRIRCHFKTWSTGNAWPYFWYLSMNTVCPYNNAKLI